MTQVNITNGVHLNRPANGVFELVKDFVAWGGTLGNRRVGTGGAGYIKVRGADFRGDVRKFKITVEGANIGYTVLDDAAEALEAEIAELMEILTTVTGAERSKFRKRLTRRQAKLAEMS